MTDINKIINVNGYKIQKFEDASKSHKNIQSSDPVFRFLGIYPGKLSEGNEKLCAQLIAAFLK